MTSVRESFVETFGEGQARAIEGAADYHEPFPANTGSDSFKWAVLTAIGWECTGRFAEFHGITIPEAEFDAWCVEHGRLGEHDGDIDSLTLLTGGYDKYIPSPSADGDES